jgi:phytol kinase
MNIMYVAFSVLAILAILVVGEAGWRLGWLKGEFGRKFVHILVGSFVAFWPFFMTWADIRLLSLAFLVVVIISEKLNVFKVVHSIQRPTFGEIYFALVVGLLTFVTRDKGIYAAALLQMSLADGFAAVIGTRYGKGNEYHIAGHVKSVVGTLTFIVTSGAIFVGYAAFSTAGLPTAREVVTGVAGAVLLENFGLFGLDNLLAPLFVGYILTHW